MNPQLTHHCLLLAPTTVLEIANQACVDATGLESASDTFTPDNIMLRDGTPYACAGVYVTNEEFTQLNAIASQLNGYYFVLMEQREVEGWVTIQTLQDCMSENNITRPEIEDA